MSTPSSLAEAMTAQKLTRTAALAWRSAFHGRSMPSALADALETLVRVGDQITAAGVVMQTAQQLRAARAATGGQTDRFTPRFDLSVDVGGGENETGLSVARGGLESNRGEA